MGQGSKGAAAPSTGQESSFTGGNGNVSFVTWLSNIQKVSSDDQFAN